MSDNEYEPSISDSESEKDSEIDEELGSDDEIEKKINEEDEEDYDDEDPEIDENDIYDDDNEDVPAISHFPEIESDEEEYEENDENYLKKFDEQLQERTIENYHPELKAHNYEEIEALCTVVRDQKGNIIDTFHKTTPILSRYERARILGERAKQINEGAQPFIEIEDSLIDGYLIAERELEQKKIPFIIQRPLPSGGSEYWRIRDLEIL